VGTAKFPPDKAWSYDELVAFLPNAASFAHRKSPDQLKAIIQSRLATAPM